MGFVMGDTGTWSADGTQLVLRADLRPIAPSNGAPFLVEVSDDDPGSVQELTILWERGSLNLASEAGIIGNLGP